MLDPWNPFGDQFPDDQKELTLQKETRNWSNHIMLRWTNGEDGPDSGIYTELVHLTGYPGNYAFKYPSVKLHSKQSRMGNKFYTLGTFTRAQRDRLVSLAQSLDFNYKSEVNTCNTWMHLLLSAMVVDGLLSQVSFDEAIQEIGLRPLEPEPPAW
ncbi:hypothetical protein B0H11DRAFT_2038600 [Mycena galericulata]|nr:hypothetical protein B0H11DRAFT_2038600 [Mycena galericulata]